jgi:predicted nuclease of predicted toxin-antitoxin system
VNFLVDHSLSPAVAEKLRQAGHDSVHARRYGIHKADDEVLFDRAAQEVRVLVSADTGFATILATRQTAKPSVILFRRDSHRRPDAQARLLLANLSTIADLLNQGSIVVFEEDRLLSRALPILRSGKL